MALRNLKPSSLADVSESEATAGTALLGQIVKGDPCTQQTVATATLNKFTLRSENSRNPLLGHEATGTVDGLAFNAFYVSMSALKVEP